jgi:peptide/nickel transport system permease protein
MKVSWMKEFRRFFRRDPLLITLSLLLVAFFVVAAVAPELLTSRLPRQMSAQLLRPPSATHYLGTDEYGRDVYTRIIYGARYSLLIAAWVITSSIVIGVVLGTLAGFLGGRIDTIIGRASDLFFALPYLIVAMAIGVALGPGMTSLIVSMSIVWWPTYVRLIRGQVLQTRNLDYVEAARALGSSRLRILWKHILPTCLGPVAVLASNNIGVVIRIAAGLSFIGLGPRPPMPEWGIMVAESREYFLSAWWVGVFPGLAIVLVGLAFSILGDALAEVIDKRESF